MHTPNARHIKIDAAMAGPLFMLSAALLILVCVIAMNRLQAGAAENRHDTN